MTFQYTKDHGAGTEFYDEVKLMSARLEVPDPIIMPSVWMSESGVHSNAHNPHGDASGLNQLMPPIARGLGWDATDKDLARYRSLSAIEQLPWVESFYRPYRGRLLSIGHAYVATFLPALLKKEMSPDLVLTAKTGPLGWAYEANMVFDENGDGAITVQELVDAVNRNCRGPRWAEIIARLKGQEDASVPPPAQYDLRTTLGLQEALDKLGFNVGVLDGIPGKATRAGVVAFQQAHALASDGVPGPLTRAALASALVALPPVGVAP